MRINRILICAAILKARWMHDTNINTFPKYHAYISGAAEAT